MAWDLDFTKSFIYEEGYAKGYEIVRAETLVEIVHALHEDGDSFKKIARITHMTEANVQAILNRPKA